VPHDVKRTRGGALLLHQAAEPGDGAGRPIHPAAPRAARAERQDARERVVALLPGASRWLIRRPSGTSSRSRTSSRRRRRVRTGRAGRNTVRACSPCCLALGANVAIAVAKAVAGRAHRQRRAALRAGHSVRTAVHRAVPAYRAAPVGEARRMPATRSAYGKERYFWSLLAAVSIFTAGALFALYQGVER